MTFEEVYAAHGVQLKRWAVWRFGVEMADDVVQEGLLHAWENWEAGEVRDNIKTWLFGVVKYTGFHMSRSGETMSSRGGKIAPFWGRNTDNVVEYNLDAVTAIAIRPSQGVALYVEQLRDHFANLGPVQHEALNALADGETAKEYSERTGRSQQAVSGALQLGRKRLREALSDDRPHAWS